MEVEPKLIYLILVGVFGILGSNVKIAITLAQLKTHAKDQNGKTGSLEKDSIKQWEKISENSAAVARMEGAHTT